MRVVKFSVLILMIMLMIAFRTDTLWLNPAQQVSISQSYSLVAWEIGNLLDKWAHRISNLVSSNSVDQSKFLQKYFDLQAKIDSEIENSRDMTGEKADNNSYGVGFPLDDLILERDAYKNDVEEILEGAISLAVNETGFGLMFQVVFPPVDIRLTQTPYLLVASPRDSIFRKYEVLLRPETDMDERIRMENELQTRYDLSAVTIRIGGLAAYPAPVAHNSQLRAVLGTAAHEWVHHYMFFRPLGQAMFSSENMVTINETVADIIGRYLADHAYGILTKEGMDPILDPISHGSAMRTPGNMEFDFSKEMRETRLHVDDLLISGAVEAAEVYMEQRRMEFVENGHHIRKLNQAYFAFYGSYAESPASSSSIGDQLNRMVELTPDFKTFVGKIAGVSSYDEFLDTLNELERSANQ